jgi:hypothetical protein
MLQSRCTPSQPRSSPSASLPQPCSLSSATYTSTSQLLSPTSQLLLFHNFTAHFRSIPLGSMCLSQLSLSTPKIPFRGTLLVPVLLTTGPLACSRRKFIAAILLFDKRDPKLLYQELGKRAETDSRAKFGKEAIAGAHRRPK